MLSSPSLAPESKMPTDGGALSLAENRLADLLLVAAAAERCAREASFLARLALDLTREDEPRAMFAEVVASLLPLIDAQTLTCMVHENVDEIVAWARAGSPTPAVSAILDAPFCRSQGGVVWETFRSGSPMYLGNYAEHPNAAPATTRAGVQAMACVPFGPVQGCDGVLIASRNDSRPWMVEDRALLECTAAALRVNMERVDRLRELREIAAYAEATVEVSQAAMEDLSPDDMARRTLEIVAALADVDLGMLAVATGDMLHRRVVWGHHPDVALAIHRDTPRGRGWAWSALEKGTATWVDDYAHTSEALPELVVAGVRSVAFVPVGADVLFVAVRHGIARPWRPRERTLFEAAARTVRVATDRTLARESLEKAALTDVLTGLRNRRALESDLRADLAEARRHGEPLMILSIDVDDLKHVNDTMGHAGGDELLRQVGTALQETFREGDRAYRVGGDEFAMILRRTGVDALRSIRGRVGDATKAVRLTFPMNHLSAGAAMFPLDGEDLESLLRVADSRMYDAKWARKTPPAP